MSKQLTSPIILMCSERSGSNLIAKILDAHPAISAPGASHLFRVMSECACTYEAGSDELRNAVWALFNAKISSWLIDDLPEGQRTALTRSHTTAAQMVAAIYGAEADANGKTLVVLKENSVYRYLPFIEAVSQEPRFLYMVRDPRDMALSWLKAPAIRGGVVRAAGRWIDDQRGFLRLASWLKGKARFSFLRYEDLLNRPEQQLTRVCSDLGLDYCDFLSNFHHETRSAVADADRSSLWRNLARPIMRENTNKFENGLDDDEVAYIEAKAEPLLSVFGYAGARPEKPRYGKFASISELEDALRRKEPYEKPSYLELSEDERRRLEKWSALYAAMSARTPLPPVERRGMPRLDQAGPDL